MSRMQEHFDHWKKQLVGSPKIVEIDEFMNVELFRRPKIFKGDEEFRVRLNNVTAKDLSESKINQLTIGPKATRVTRMEVVARIAIHMFDCKVVGGFVRDWIVRGESTFIDSNGSKKPSDWVIAKPYVKWEISKSIIPSDLDMELSMSTYFDVNRFISEVRKCGIVVDDYDHVAGRHMMLFETERGPFTADFVEPHFAVLHSLADINVNTMCLVKYADLIGLKAHYEFNNPKEGDIKVLTVDHVIESCLKKEYFSMQEHGQQPKLLEERSQKMKSRGWTMLPAKVCLPIGKSGNTVTSVHKTDQKFKKYAARLEALVYDPSRPSARPGKGRLLAMYSIDSTHTQAHYQAMKNELCSNPNNVANGGELELFHGTPEDVVSISFASPLHHSIILL